MRRSEPSELPDTCKHWLDQDIDVQSVWDCADSKLAGLDAAELAIQRPPSRSQP